MPTRNVPLASAGPRVADVMLHGPRTLGPTDTVAAARRAFENPRERMLVVTRGERFLGVVSRDAVADDLPGDTPLEALMRADGSRVGPDEPVARALALLDADDADRLPVVDADGTLVGLVCFNRSRGHFCASVEPAAQPGS